VASGERAAAREHFERAVVLDPAFARARENLARIAESAPVSK
jgi:Flp pilus assembly protein TadD